MTYEFKVFQVDETFTMAAEGNTRDEARTTLQKELDREMIYYNHEIAEKFILD